MKFIIVIVTLVVIGLISDFYIYRIFIKNTIVKKLFLLKSIVMQLLIMLTLLLFRQIPQNDLSWLLIFYLLIYLPQSLFFAFSVLDYVVRWKVASFRYFSLIGAIVAFAGFGVILYGMTYGRSVARIERVTVESSRLPDGFDGYRIVQLSDLHVGNFGKNTTIIENVVNRVNALNPDVIMVTGDLVNLKADELKPFLSILSQLKAKDGVFSVLGNHDYGDYVTWNSPEEKAENLNRLKEMQSGMSWRMLNNTHCFLRKGDDSVTIIGVENWGLPPFKKAGDLGAAYPSLQDKMFKILLSHNPTHWDAEVTARTTIDLTLAGHTHAMQMKLTVFGKSYSLASMMYYFWSGLYRKGEQYLYVNDGIGYVGIPLRIGTQPEITEISLKKI